jgi:hypothetical protein
MIKQKRKILRVFLLSVGFIISFIISCLIISFIAGKIQLNLAKSRMIIGIKNKHPKVTFVEIAGEEDFPPLEDGFMTVCFNGNGSLKLANVSETQNDIIFRSCDGYNFFVFQRLRTESTSPEKIVNTWRRLSNKFCEKILDIPLNDIDDFINGYETIKTYMDNLIEIPKSEFDKWKSGEEWLDFIESTQNIKIYSDENSDYYILKTRSP